MFQVLSNSNDLQAPNLLPVNRPDETAVVAPDRELTWQQIERRARQVANALDSENIGADEGWAVLAHNRSEWAELLLGNGRAGARMVPLNWHLTARELSEILIDSGANLILVEQELASVIGEAASMADIDRIITFGPEYEAWIEGAGDNPLTERGVGFPMLFTGGTTGRSKGVVRSDQGGDASDWATRWSGLGLVGSYAR